MRKGLTMSIVLLLVVSLQVFGSIVPSQVGNDGSQNNVIDSVREEQLHGQYLAFLETLDLVKLEADYAGAVRKVRSLNPDDQKKGLQVLGACDEIDAIALIVGLLDSEDEGVRIHAGLALDHIVSGNELKRRDFAHSDKIVLLPRSPEDIDLRPLAWIILKMMRGSDDGNTAAYAATMAGYLGLSEFRGELKRLLKSRHPAVSRSATYALSVLKSNPNIDESLLW
jgi:hypothetical protein